MRIATSTIFEAGVRQLGTLQSDMAKLQTQMSSNKRVVTPSDDPVAASRALEVTQSQSLNTQLATNRSNARSALSQEEVTLNGVTSLLQDVQDLVVSSGNGTFTDADRASKATELEGRLQDLLGLANTADGNGGFMFSGYKSATQPFNLSATGADYAGDQGQRMVQIGSTRVQAAGDDQRQRDLRRRPHRQRHLPDRGGHRQHRLGHRGAGLGHQPQRTEHRQLRDPVLGRRHAGRDHLQRERHLDSRRRPAVLSEPGRTSAGAEHQLRRHVDQTSPAPRPTATASR